VGSHDSGNAEGGVGPDPVGLLWGHPLVADSTIRPTTLYLSSLLLRRHSGRDLEKYIHYQVPPCGHRPINHPVDHSRLLLLEDSKETKESIREPTNFRGPGRVTNKRKGKESKRREIGVGARGLSCLMILGFSISKLLSSYTEWNKTFYKLEESGTGRRPFFNVIWFSI